jgi:hypothetical protein
MYNLHVLLLSQWNVKSESVKYVIYNIENGYMISLMKYWSFILAYRVILCLTLLYLILNDVLLSLPVAQLIWTEREWHNERRMLYDCHSLSAHNEVIIKSIRTRNEWKWRNCEAIWHSASSIRQILLMSFECDQACVNRVKCVNHVKSCEKANYYYHFTAIVNWIVKMYMATVTKYYF